MIDGKKVFGLVQVRSGSKRIKDKNIKDLAGKPLYAWSLDEARKSKYIDDIYISSSSSWYKGIFEYQGYKIIDRPAELSVDNVPNLPVYKHAITEIPCKDYDYIVHIDICKPFTTVEQIDSVIDEAFNNNRHSVFTVKELKCNIIGDDAAVSQDKKDKEKKFIYFGAVRLFTKETIEKAELGTWGKGINHIDLPIINDWEFDIDYEWQFLCAETLLEEGYKKC